MKHVKKLASLLLALVMVLSMGVTALAADPTPDPTTTDSGHTYQIYQIFTGDYSNGILSNVKWGKNGTGAKGTDVANEVLTELEGVNQPGKSDTDRLAAIQKYAKLDAAEGETIADPFLENSATTYTNMPNGYYLIRDKAGTQNGEDKFYTLYIVEVVNGTLVITPKGDVPKSEKKIVEGDNKLDTNEASIGDKVEYEITGTMPTKIDAYKEYYYVFTDTLSKGLTFNADSLKVTAVTPGENGTTKTVDLTNDFYKNVVTNGDGTKTLTVGVQNLLWYKDKAGITQDTKIIVTYSATLNKDAVIAGTGNTNDVTLKYSNDPNHSGDGTTTPPDTPEEPEPEHPTGDTPTNEVVTYTTELTITKTDKDGQILAGAEFTLSGDSVNIVLVTTEEFTEDAAGEYWKLTDGTYTKTAPTVTGDKEDNSADYESTTTKYKKSTVLSEKTTTAGNKNVVGTVDSETGTVTFKGLGVGTYTIKETKTPAGYNTIDDISFDLTFNKDNKQFSVENVTEGQNITVANNVLATTIVNYQGATLPETGGIGTTIFYVVGAILMIGAGVMLVTRKRISK